MYLLVTQSSRSSSELVVGEESIVVVPVRAGGRSRRSSNDFVVLVEIEVHSSLNLEKDCASVFQGN
jgi:uncharacterized protein YjlB